MSRKKTAWPKVPMQTLIEPKVSIKAWGICGAAGKTTCVQSLVKAAALLLFSLQEDPNVLENAACNEMRGGITHKCENKPSNANNYFGIAQF